MPKRSAANITIRSAEAAAPGLLWDREVPGFGLRVLASGLRTWLLKYRAPGGQQRWHRIGLFPDLTVEEARRLARALKVQVEAGRDPSREREEAEAAARRAQAAAVEVMAESYAEALPGRPSLKGGGAITPAHAHAEAAAVRRAIAIMGIAGRPVSEVGQADLLRLLRAEAGRQATARMLFGAFGRFLEWCREGGALASNPCDAIPKARRPKPPPPRRRVVALPDLARLWIAADALVPPYPELARLLIAVPVRRGEAAALRWEHLDWRAGIWTLPGLITKNGDPHRIALPKLALAMLRARHAAHGKPARGLAFPSPRAGEEVSGWTTMKRDLSAAAGGFYDWTWHDFRRSFASIMAERGVPEPVADAVLNHRQSGTRGGVLGVYQQAERWPEQRDAMQGWGAALSEAIAAASKKKRGTGAASGPSAQAPATPSHPAPRNARAPGAAPKAHGASKPSRRAKPSRAKRPARRQP
jgi:integrase